MKLPRQYAKPLRARTQNGKDILLMPTFIYDVRIYWALIAFDIFAFIRAMRILDGA